MDIQFTTDIREFFYKILSMLNRVNNPDVYYRRYRDEPKQRLFFLYVRALDVNITRLDGYNEFISSLENYHTVNLDDFVQLEVINMTDLIGFYHWHKSLSYNEIKLIREKWLK
jgi:hypothetical protein